jgi:hypothetical protein
MDLGERRVLMVIGYGLLVIEAYSLGFIVYSLGFIV